MIAGGVELGVAFLRTAELFNPAHDTFTALPASGPTELHFPRVNAVAAPLRNGQVLIAGGADHSRSAELFNPANDTFTALPIASGG